MVYAGRTTSDNPDNSGQRRTSCVPFGVPERPGLQAFFRRPFVKERDSDGLNVKSRSFHQFDEPFDASDKVQMGRHNVAQVDMYRRCARPGGRLDRTIMRRNMSACGSLLITGASPWFPRSRARLPGQAG
jgi:hypothetical protein